MCPFATFSLILGWQHAATGAQTTESWAGCVEGGAAMGHSHLGPMGVCQMVHIDCAVAPCTHCQQFSPFLRQQCGPTKAQIKKLRESLVEHAAMKGCNPLRARGCAPNRLDWFWREAILHQNALHFGFSKCMRRSTGARHMVLLQPGFLGATQALWGHWGPH
jgi:hypothetical protein